MRFTTNVGDNLISKGGKRSVLWYFRAKLQSKDFAFKIRSAQIITGIIKHFKSNKFMKLFDLN